jgi:hypothetical protein
MQTVSLQRRAKISFVSIFADIYKNHSLIDQSLHPRENEDFT